MLTLEQEWVQFPTLRNIYKEADMWLFPYSKSYYLRHPLRYLKHLIGNLKWAWQRAMRGWDDTDGIDVTWFMANIIPQMLFYLLEHNKIDWDWNPDSDGKETENEWECTIYDIRVGLLSAKAILDFDYDSPEEHDFLLAQCKKGLKLLEENFFKLNGF